MDRIFRVCMRGMIQQIYTEHGLQAALIFLREFFEAFFHLGGGGGRFNIYTARFAGGTDLPADAAVQHCRCPECDDSHRFGGRAAGMAALRPLWPSGRSAIQKITISKS
jgi:hypothetical protein